MKALVTGGAGFIGSHICDRLIAGGNKVVCYDNLLTGKIENIKHLMGKKGFKFIEGDVRDAELLDTVLKDVDIVFNQMASKKTICEKDPVEDCSINAGGTLTLLLAMKHAGVKKIVHASTGSVYGECMHRITEFTPTNPVSYYGVSKLAGENYVAVFGDMFGFEYTILRYFHVYGERQDSSQYGGVIPIFIDRILNSDQVIVHGDGTQTRSFTYVKDVVDANMYAAADLDNGIYNCASGLKISINDLVYKLREHFGYFGVINDKPVLGDVKNFEVDNRQIRNDYPITFTNFEYGLRKTIEYYAAI